MPSILCVEDETHLREDIAEELRDSGFTTYEARDGVEGLQMILRHKPDMVVSDISMPRLNGHELVRALRNDHPEFSEMPVIFLTAYNDRKDLLEGLKIGADDYLTKPVNYELLQAKIASYLRQSERMIARKKQENVRLYKALNARKADPAREPKPTATLFNIVLVGESAPDLWAVQRQLEDQRADVRVFTSGFSFLKKGAQNPAHAVLVWPTSDDIDRAKLAAEIPSSDARLIAVLRDESEQTRISEKFDDTVTLPFESDQMKAKLNSWANTRKAP